MSLPLCWPATQPTFFEVCPDLSSSHRQRAVNCCRAIVFFVLFSLILLPEFSSDGFGSQSWLYSKATSGFRFVDLAILALVFPHLVVLVCSRKQTLRFPRALGLPVLVFLFSVALGFCYGALRDGINLFFDWRALALGIGLYVVWTFWIQKNYDQRMAVIFFGIYLAARIAILYVQFLVGHGDRLLGVSIPLFDGPSLSCIVFAALLAMACRDTPGKGIQKILWTLLAVAAGAMVLVCLRRTYWGELFLGMLFLLLLQRGHRLRRAICIGLLVGCVALALGRSAVDRAVSLDFTQDDSPLAVDNSDHVNDLRDAWEQVRQAPVLGIGLGTAYSTWHIRNWKSESVMVHNAPLHVWLKYGLLGVISYGWFHLVLLLLLYRRVRFPELTHQPFAAAAFAYIAAQFIMTLGFAPWPYSELQMTTLISFVLAGTFALPATANLVEQQA